MRLVIAFVLMVAVTLIAASVLSGLTRTMPYEGEPQFTQHPPVRFLMRSGLGDRQSLHRDFSSEGSRGAYTYEITIRNETDRAKRFRAIEEYRDGRGTLVHRHIIGPIDAPPLAEVRYQDSLRLSSVQARSVIGGSSWIEPIE